MGGEDALVNKSYLLFFSNASYDYMYALIVSSLNIRNTATSFNELVCLRIGKRIKVW
mgnify:CR=1 FL=1